MKLILASASPRRRELLGMIAPVFETAALYVYLFRARWRAPSRGKNAPRRRRRTRRTW